jgi:hypothetical protein
MRLKMDLRGRYAPSATILDTPTGNAPLLFYCHFYTTFI